MMGFCVAPGAAFVVTFLGCGLLGSVALGWMLFGAATLSGLLLGILSGFGKPLPKERDFSPPREALPPWCARFRTPPPPRRLCAGAFCCSPDLPPFSRAAALFRAWPGCWPPPGCSPKGRPLPASPLSWKSPAAREPLPPSGAGPALYAFGLAFGGLCVHLQLFSFFPEFPLGKLRFFLGRILHGLLSAGIFLALERLVPGPVQPVWAVSGTPLEYGITASTWAGGLSLLLMCLAFLLVVSKSRS